MTEFPSIRHARQRRQKINHPGYKDYIHGIVLSNILEEEMRIQRNVHNHVQLKNLADDILKNATTRNYRMMNQKILLQIEDISRGDALLKNLEDFLRRIPDCSTGRENKLVRIAYELARRVELIPVQNGAGILMNQLEAITFSKKDPKNMNPIQGVNYLIQKLDECLHSLDGVQSKLIKSKDVLHEMNRIILKVVSHLLSKRIITEKGENEAK